MTFYMGDFEGGTVGAGITLGNSGGVSGTACRTNITGTSTLTYTTEQVFQGAIAAKHDNAAGGQAALRLPSGISSPNWAHSFPFYLAALPPSGQSHKLENWLNVGGDDVMSLFINPDGTIRGRQRNATTNTSGLSGGVTALAAGQWYEVDVVIIPGTTTGNGTLKYQIRAGGTSTVLISASMSGTADAGTTNIVDGYWGRTGNQSFGLLVYTDRWRAEDAAGGAFLGLYTPPANAAPVVTPPAKALITQGQTVSGTMVATDSDGTITEYLWTPTLWPAGAAQPTLSNSTTVTFTSSVLSVVGHYEFTPAAKDNSGVWTTGAPFRVGVAASDNSSDPIGIIDNPGGWSGVITDVTDSSDSTGLIAPANAAAAKVILRMAPVTTGDIAFDDIKSLLVSGATIYSIRVDLISGTNPAATPFATRTFTLTTTLHDYADDVAAVLTSPEQAGFTDRVDWMAAFVANP